MRWIAALFLIACSTSPRESVRGDTTSEAGTRRDYLGRGEDLPAARWQPSPPTWKPGDLHDLACRRAAQLGCLDAKDVGSCATTLAKQNGKLWEMRMQTVLAAKTKQHVSDSTVIPCDAWIEE